MTNTLKKNYWISSQIKDDYDVKNRKPMSSFIKISTEGISR